MEVFLIARLPRIDVAGVVQHVIQRGVDRTACFCSDEDRRFYLSSLRTAANTNGCGIHAYVLMTNHVHLLVTGEEVGSVSAMMQSLGRRYVRRFNSKYKRTGTLWEGRFKSCLVDSEYYLLRCHLYIELNPVRAGMVINARNHRWSSIHANAYGKPDSLVNQHSVLRHLGSDNDSRLENYRVLLDDLMPEGVLTRIRTHTNQGKVLGTQKFQRKIGELTGRSVMLKSMGRPRKQKSV